MTHPILQAKNISKHYGKLTAVKDVSLNMYAGKCLGLLGPNGAGKTTTIEILEAITRADSGSVLYKGEPVGRSFKNQAGIMFQATALQEFITVKETLMLFSGLYEQSIALDDLIVTCDLSEFLDQDNKKLSGGQRQRLLFAIALVNNPDVLFLDEPTTGLDPQSRRNFWSMIKSIKAQGKTILLTTHYMEEAFELCDDLAIMDHGEVISSGTPKQLLSQHFNDVIVSLPLDAMPQDELRANFNAVAESNHLKISTNQVEQLLVNLQQNNVPLNGLRIREATLEDLFLKLTGQGLRQ